MAVTRVRRTATLLVPSRDETPSRYYCMNYTGGGHIKMFRFLGFGLFPEKIKIV